MALGLNYHEKLISFNEDNPLVQWLLHAYLASPTCPVNYNQVFMPIRFSL